VNDSEGAPVLVVEFRPNKDRGQSLKNPASWRSLPIHSELLRLGFREYWQAIGQAQDGKPGPLFPAIPTKGDNGPGGQFGQWFGKFKEAQGFSTTKTLHSFRHTAETELAFAEVSPTKGRASGASSTGPPSGATRYASARPWSACSFPG